MRISGLVKKQRRRNVGGGLFSYTNDEGLYAVGVYDRTLF